MSPWEKPAFWEKEDTAARERRRLATEYRMREGRRLWDSMSPTQQNAILAEIGDHDAAIMAIGTNPEPYLHLIEGSLAPPPLPRRDAEVVHTVALQGWEAI